MAILLPEEIDDLFDPDDGSTNGRRGLWLTERYKIAIGGEEINAVLASLYVHARKIPRIEIICVSESESLLVVVDSLITISVHHEGFEQFAAFLAQLSLPLAGA